MQLKFSSSVALVTFQWHMWPVAPVTGPHRTRTLPPSQDTYWTALLYLGLMGLGTHLCVLHYTQNVLEAAKSSEKSHNTHFYYVHRATKTP